MKINLEFNSLDELHDFVKSYYVANFEPTVKTPVEIQTPEPKISISYVGNQKIRAIKLVREFTFLSLREAKELIDKAYSREQSVTIKRGDKLDFINRFYAIGGTVHLE